MSEEDEFDPRIENFELSTEFLLFPRNGIGPENVGGTLPVSERFSVLG